MKPNKPEKNDSGGRNNRGQAFTLEGLVSGIMIVVALWYAFQVIIMTPASGGAMEASERENIQQQADDALLLADQADDEPLSELVRNWSQGRRTFSGAADPDVGYGTRPLPGEFGEILEESFTHRGQLYNIEMEYMMEDPSNGTRTTTIASQGTPSSSSVVATQRVVLYDNMTLTSDSTGSAELVKYDRYPSKNPVPGKGGYYPVPNAVDGPVYNIVEVRLIVW